LPTTAQIHCGRDEFVSGPADVDGFKGDEYRGPGFGCGLEARNICRFTNSFYIKMVDKIHAAFNKLLHHYTLKVVRRGDILVRLVGTDLWDTDDDAERKECHVLMTLPCGRPEVHTLSFCVRDAVADVDHCDDFPYDIVSTEAANLIEGHQCIGQLTDDELGLQLATTCRTWKVQVMTYEILRPHKMRVQAVDPHAIVQLIEWPVGEVKQPTDKAKELRARLALLGAVSSSSALDTPPPPPAHPTKRRRMTGKQAANMVRGPPVALTSSAVHRVSDVEYTPGPPVSYGDLELDGEECDDREHADGDESDCSDDDPSVLESRQHVDTVDDCDDSTAREFADPTVSGIATAIAAHIIGEHVGPTSAEPAGHLNIGCNLSVTIWHLRFPLKQHVQKLLQN